MNPRKVLLKWKKPEFIYGAIGSLRVNFKHKLDGKWISEKRIVIQDRRELTLSTKPYTEYKIAIEESPGAKEKWGKLSKDCTIRTMEGGLLCE